MLNKSLNLLLCLILIAQLSTCATMIFLHVDKAFNYELSGIPPYVHDYQSREKELRENRLRESLAEIP